MATFNLRTGSVTPASEPPAELILATGEIVDPTNADELITLFEAVDARARTYNETKAQLARAIAALTRDDDRRTRRIRGAERQAKVEMPDDYWDQTILKEAWNSFPKLRDEVLAIGSIKIRKREWKKIESATGDKTFETFRKMVGSANKGPSGTPRITVEK